MAWKPIPFTEWAARAETDFWTPYARKRSAHAKQQMVRKQFEQLNCADTTAAHALAARLASNEDEAAQVRAYCLHHLATNAEQVGAIDDAIDQAVQCCQLDESSGLPLLVQLICDYDRRDRASEVAMVVRQLLAEPEPLIDSGRKLHLAVLLALAGDEADARDLANAGFDELVQSSKGWMYRKLARASANRSIDRALFALVRRGGAVRFVGLLGADSRVTPKQLTTKLCTHVYFDKSSIDSSADRVVVDLTEFSLDFRWTTDPELIEQVQRRYGNFKYEDRRHIPQPPDTPQHALIVLAIGDDASIPDVVNPLIELVGVLDEFGECIFYDRVGPLSRRDVLPPVEATTVADVDKLIRARIKPLFVDAGFTKCTTRRFVLTEGPLGYVAGVFLRIDKERLKVAAQLQIYYRDLVENELLQKYYNANGEFQPKSFLFDQYRMYHAEFADWKPEDPSHESVAQMIDDVAAKFRAEWLPLIERTREPRAEIAWIVANLDTVGDAWLWPSRNRFGATTKAELAVAMARLIGADDLLSTLSARLQQ